jgi:hypothetical protein
MGPSGTGFIPLPILYCARMWSGIFTPLRYESLCLAFVLAPIYNCIVGSGLLIFSRSRWVVMDHGRRNRWIIIAALGCPGGDGMRGTYPHGGLQYEPVPGAKKSKSL